MCAASRAQGVYKMYFILLLYSMLDKVSTGFQNVPQNGRREHDNNKNTMGGSFTFCSRFVLNREQKWNKSGTNVCSRFVHALFSDVNKSGTNHEHPKCCKIVTLLQNCHTVAHVPHCCKIVTLLRIGGRSAIVATMWRQCGPWFFFLPQLE